MSDTFDHNLEAEERYLNGEEDNTRTPDNLPTRDDPIGPHDPQTRRQATSLKRYFDDVAAKHGIF